MNAGIKLAYWAYFATPKEYGHLFFDMEAEKIEQIVLFIQQHSTGNSKAFDDLAAYVMSILFSLNVDG